MTLQLSLLINLPNFNGILNQVPVKGDENFDRDPLDPINTDKLEQK